MVVTRPGLEVACDIMEYVSGTVATCPNCTVRIRAFIGAELFYCIRLNQIAQHMTFLHCAELDSKSNKSMLRL
jgi:hypothetical protein